MDKFTEDCNKLAEQARNSPGKNYGFEKGHLPPMIYKRGVDPVVVAVSTASVLISIFSILLSTGVICICS